MAWVVDRSLDVLLAQIDAAAPGRSKASDGSIGDAAHAASVSAHNPQRTWESSDGNDPDFQVDARDITHDPRFAGSDMGLVTEAIRQSKDRRVRLVIFNKRIFASYANGSRPAWTWGPYSGDNDHSKHAHVETNDLHNDSLAPWRISLAPILTEEEEDMEHWFASPRPGEGLAPGELWFGNIREKWKVPASQKGILEQTAGREGLGLLKLNSDKTAFVRGNCDGMGPTRVDLSIDYAKLAAEMIARLPAGLPVPTAQEHADAVVDELASRLAD